MEYYSIEPWGTPAHDIMNAHQMSLSANLKRDPKYTPEPYRMVEFLAFPPPEPEPEFKEEPRVDGLTAKEWQQWFAAQRLTAARNQSNQAT